MCIFSVLVYKMGSKCNFWCVYQPVILFYKCCEANRCPEVGVRTFISYTWQDHWASWSSWGRNCSSWRTWVPFRARRLGLWFHWSGPSRPPTGTGCARTPRPPHRGPLPARLSAPRWRWLFLSPSSLTSSGRRRHRPPQRLGCRGKWLRKKKHYHNTSDDLKAGSWIKSFNQRCRKWAQFQTKGMERVSPACLQVIYVPPARVLTLIVHGMLLLHVLFTQQAAPEAVVAHRALKGLGVDNHVAVEAAIGGEGRGADVALEGLHPYVKGQN